MADLHRVGHGERDIDQAITALKKGAYLLKYGRRGKPKFCPFRLSPDESMLIWYYGKDEKHLELCNVTKIIPGQRTAIFQRYPRPEKEYQSLSLIYNDRSLDVICKDKEEAEVWFVGLKALITRGSYRKVRTDSRSDCVSSDSPRARRVSPSRAAFDQGDTQRNESIPLSRLGKAFADIVSYTASPKNGSQSESFTYSPNSISSGGGENSNGRISAADTFRVSLSSALSSSSQGSGHEDIDSLGDVFIWGEGTGDGLLGGGVLKAGRLSGTKIDAHLPKVLESTMVLDVHSIACGSKHAVLVTKQGEIFSWGEELGGRLGHGVKADVSHPKLIDTLTGTTIEMVACGEYHTCAVTLSGDLYTWGDGIHNSGLLGHGSEVSHWIPKKVSGPIEGIQVSYVSCGPWHTALLTSAGQLFTCGDGTFGVLGHGDLESLSIPREVETLRGLRTVRVACGVWHTAAVVEVTNRTSLDSGLTDGSFSGKLFTWGDGDKGRLGHGDKKPRLFPEIVAALVDISFSQVACAHNLTIGLTNSGEVYTMGSSDYGQLGNPLADGKIPTCIGGKFAKNFVEEIACGSHHVAVLTSRAEVYTWGKGSNGQLGHGDNHDRNIPTLVDFLKDKQVKSVVCGSKFTAVICPHKWVSSADNSECSGCHTQFSFRRKRHNCYNCGLVFCSVCSSRKSLKASLAPSTSKPYRVCDDCFNKLQKVMESGSDEHIPVDRNGSGGLSSKETDGPRLQGQFSRLSSFDSFNQGEGRSSKKVESNDSHMYHLSNGNNNLRGSISISKAPTTTLFGASKSFSSISAPNSKMVSRATSPLTAKTCPSRSATPTPPPFSSSLASEVILEDPKHTSQEVTYLKAQVEELAKKSQHLEAELERKTRELKEATELAADEAEKGKAAKEVIKSLTAQLKEMAERMPEGHNNSSSTTKSDSHYSEKMSNDPSKSSWTSLASSKSECSDNSTSHSSLVNGTKSTQTERAEWVVQDEPGVYITLSSIPGGGNDLKRVRFSRKRFTEQQAEKWWAENGAKVCERHNIRIAE